VGRTFLSDKTPDRPPTPWQAAEIPDSVRDLDGLGFSRAVKLFRLSFRVVRSRACAVRTARNLHFLAAAYVTLISMHVMSSCWGVEATNVFTSKIIRSRSTSGAKPVFALNTASIRSSPYSSPV
jgi:hypothetical protein